MKPLRCYSAAAVLAAWCAAGSAAPEPAPPSLLSLYQTALETNPALRAQRSAIDRAQARADLASSRLRPQLALTLSGARNDFRAEDASRNLYNSERKSVNLRQPLLDVASRRLASAEAMRIEQARLEHEALRVELAARIVEQLLDALNAVEELGAVQAEQQAVSGQRDRVARLVERQMAKQPDLLEAEARLATLAAREIEVRNELRVAIEALVQSTGIPVSTLPRLVAPSLPRLSGEFEEWLQRAVQGSPVLAASQQALQAEQRTVSSARAQHLPQLALIAGQTWSDTDAESRRNTPYTVRSVGLTLTVGLYEGGRVDATVREALAREAQAEAQLEERHRQLELQLRTAWLTARSQLQRAEATLQTAEAQERARDALQRGFELGAATMVDLLLTQQRLFRARADHARARHEYLRSLVRLRRHSGTLDEEEMQGLSGLFAAALPPRN
ncbi:TolC family outer membrane protein [Caldimonas tepidiphila]|uniref:TolC family outer membrane protein n=1 Tax=Caldimonas tepidiphila TaxID=2315841 RepID=UPI000E5B7C5E|nr:TolC family outer membrane protein [Caldimonas tepidiphila]